MFKYILVFGAGAAVGYSVRGSGDVQNIVNEFRNDPEIQKALNELREALKDLKGAATETAEKASGTAEEVVDKVEEEIAPTEVLEDEPEDKP